MEKKYKAYYQSPIGTIEIIGTDKAILALDFVEQAGPEEEISPCIKACMAQLDEYFQGTRKEFSVPVALEGTDFQKRTWQALCTIPYGAVVSYKDIAAAVGNPKAVRAVGGANHKNKISIIVPCHRVIGSDGTLTGYGGGLWRKEWLLKHEKENMA